jgi:hypothetical protein
VTAVAELPARPLLSLVPPVEDADLAAALRTAGVAWQMLDRTQADLARVAEDAEWRRRRDVLAALLPYGLDDRPPLDERLAEAGWARPEPIPVVLPLTLYQTAGSAGKYAARFHALGPSGDTACGNMSVAWWSGRPAEDIPERRQCRHQYCRAAFGRPDHQGVT